MRKINDGLARWKRYDLRHPERRKEIKKRYREKHPDYWKLSPEAIQRRQTRQRIAYANNPAKHIAIVRRYQKRNEEMIRQKYKKYCRTDKYAELNRMRVQKPAYRFSIAKSTARQRNLPWNIQASDYFELIDKRCYYCDSPLNPYGVGLDRIDNAKGYIVGNVVPCCSKCNWDRCNRLTHEEMKFVMDALKKHRLQKAMEGVSLGD